MAAEPCAGQRGGRFCVDQNRPPRIEKDRRYGERDAGPPDSDLIRCDLIRCDLIRCDLIRCDQTMN